VGDFTLLDPDLKKANPKDQCGQEDREKQRTSVSIESACIHPESYIHEERETMKGGMDKRICLISRVAAGHRFGGHISR